MTDLERFKEPQRLHPLTLVPRLLASVPALLFLLAPVFFRGPDRGAWFSLFLALVYGLVALPLLVLQYFRFRFWIAPDALLIHSGVLTRRKRSIPLERIQNIVIERGLLARLFGMAKVKIETAGSTSTEGVLEYVALDDAHAIREVVRTFQGRPDAAPEAAAEGAPFGEAAGARAETGAEAGAVLFEMPLPRVMLSGAFRFSLLYLALIFTGLQYLLDLSGMDPEDLVLWFTRGSLRPVAEVAASSPWLLGFVSVVAAALLGWLTGVLINLNRFYGFKLWLEGDKLQRRHGLFTVSEGTIPLRKVQALILRSNPLMQAFGWYRLELQTMGYDVEDQGHQVAAPFAQKDDILKLAPHIRPFTLPETFTPVSRLMIRRRFIRYTVGLLVVLAPLAYFWRPAWWGLLLIPLLFGLAVLQYRRHGYATHEGMLFVRRGFFRHYVWVIPVERFQVFYTSSSLFQRRLALKSILVDTAGAGSFSFPRIVDVAVEEADRLLHRLNEQFQAFFARPRETVEPAGDAAKRMVDGG